MPEPFLLRGAAYESVAARTSRDFQARVGQPSIVDDDGFAPCVLVLSRAADREIDELSLWLAASGIPLVRLDADRCVGLDLQWLPHERLVTLSGKTFRPRVGWLRYFDPAAIDPTAADPAPADAATGRGAYTRDQWSACAAALTATAAPRAVNAGARPGHPDRIAQLAAARRAGLRVPATVVATSLADAAAALPGPEFIVKSLGRHAVETPPGRLRGVFPRRVAGRALAAERTGEPAPVLLQQYLRAPRELRIYVVGGQLIGYAVTRPSPEALWTDPAAIGVRPHGVPDQLAGPLRALADGFGLDVAAFDLLDTVDGPVFLEVNAECDWLWAEKAAGDGAVSAAVRELITKLYEERPWGT